MMYGARNIFRVCCHKEIIYLYSSLIFLIFSFLPTTTFAAQVDANWIGAASGSYNTGSNWSGGVVPNNSTDTYNVKIDNGNTGQATTVTLNTINPTVDNLTIDASDTFIVANGRVFTVTGGSGAGTITTNGTLSIDSSGSVTSLTITGASVTPVTINGPGSVVLGDSFSRIVGVSSNDQLVNNATIVGAGNIGVNLLKVRNAGSIVANTSGSLLTLDLLSVADAGVNTGGYMGALSGAILSLAAGNLTNTGGTIQAALTGTVRLAGINIKGGTIDIFGTGAVDVTASSTLDTAGATVTITGAGNMTINNGVTLTVTGGTLINNSRIDTAAGGVTTSVNFTGNTTVNGTGDIVLANNGEITGSSGARLTLESGQTVTLDGAVTRVGDNILNVTNRGLIKAIKTGTVGSIDAPVGGEFFNEGNIRAEDFATVAFQPGLYDNALGTIEAAASSLVTYNGAEIEGGQLTGSGIHRIVTGVATLDGGTSAFTIASGARMEQSNGITTNVIGELIIDGTFHSMTGGFLTNVEVGTNSVALNGTGRIILGSGGLSNNSAIRATGGGIVTVGSGLTIEGIGAFLNNNGNGVNNGLILANVSGESIFIDPGVGGSMTNLATERASGGGIITLSSGLHNNAGGVTEALTGSRIDVVGGATLIGGTYNTSGTGEMRFTSNTPRIVGVTFGSGANVIDGTNIEMSGLITNNGSIKNQPTSLTLTLAAVADTTFSGTGRVILGEGTTSTLGRISGLGGTFTLNNAAGHTIEGQGIIGSLLTIDNDGTINANRSGLTLELNTPATIIGGDGMFASSGGRLLASDGITGTNTSSLVVDSGGEFEMGAFTALFGTVTINGIADVNGGILASIGAFTVGSGADLQLASGISAGSFSFALTNETLWDLDGLTAFLIITGGVGATQPAGYATLEIGGTDFGDDPYPGTVTPDAAGFVSNFDITTLTIATNGRTMLVDAINNGNRNGEFGAAEALYVDVLTLQDGAQLLVNGLNLYYNTLNLGTGASLEQYNTFDELNDISPGNTQLNLLAGTADPTILWDTLTGDGLTTMLLETSLPSLPAGIGFVYNGSDAVYYDITTTAPFTGNFTVTFSLAGLTFGSPNDIVGIKNGTVVLGTYNSGANTYSFTASSFSDFGLGTTPEPSTLFLMLSGLFGLYRFRRYFRKS